MYITKITLNNYRNILSAEVTPARGVTVFHGRNGQGKTNLLEAVNVFAQGRPFRTRREKDLIYGIAGTANGEPVTPDKAPQFARAAVDFESSGRATHEEIVWAADGTKKLTRDDITVRPSDFIGRFRAVLFSPENLSLVKAGPAGRRAFIDFAVSQLDPAYLASLTRYNRAVTQRSALLKSWRSLDGKAKESLAVYTPVLAHEAAYITGTRVRYVEALSKAAAAVYAEMTNNAEIMRAHYTGSHTEEEFAAMYRDFETRDIEAGMTTVGPHRDDVTLLLDGVPARQMASQGQQRAIVLALKLGEGELSRRSTGEYPVFLLDDVLSEIDAPRREYLMSRLGGGGRQALLTTCENDITGERIYEVEKGRFWINEK